MLDSVLDRVIVYLKTPMCGRVFKQYPDCSAYQLSSRKDCVVYRTYYDSIPLGRIQFFTKPLQSKAVECKTRGTKEYLFGWFNTQTDVVAFVFWRYDSKSVSEKIEYLKNHGYTEIGGELIA